MGHPKMSDQEAKDFFVNLGKQLAEGIDIFDGFRIRRISEEDIQDFQNYLFTLPIPSISGRSFVIEKHITDEDKLYPDIHKTMLNIVLALRLLKKGSVRGNAVFNILLSDKRSIQLISWEEESAPQTISSMYVLSLDEIPELKRLSKSIQKIDFAKNKSLHLACKRFQKAYGESDDEDKLIDFMIAFEALFLKGEKTGSSSGQVIAVACSVLLGKNNEERQDILDFMNKAYSLRNHLVHGSECKESIDICTAQYSLREFVGKLEEYLRDSVKKFLN